MELSVYNKDGQDTGKKVTLSAEVFGIEPNEHVVYLDIKQFLANQRQGTHKAKQRAEISRSTRKLFRQKGTGGARHGSAKAPIYVGGGRVFGPTPRDYHFKLNKKVKALARKSAFSSRAIAGNIMVVEDFSFDAPKTKNYLTFLNAFSLSNTKSLLITGDNDTNVFLSSRNIPKAKVTSASQVNAHDLIGTEKVLISLSALSKIETMLK